jgi:excisionase family DNA binding protein
MMARDTQSSTAPERLIDIQELSERLGVPVSWLYDRTRKIGGIPHHKLGRYVRFAPSEIESWLDSHRTGANHA